MAVIASAFATFLHEGVGHGATAWLRGDVVTELTSNHLSSLREDRWVSAGGTLVNLAVGAIAILLSRRAGDRANPRYFWWLLAALNLLPAAGYFLLSGVTGFGDWYQVIAGMPHEIALRIAMAIFGFVLYYAFVILLAREIRPFAPDAASYNTVGRLPYYAACLFSCAAGIFDPMGIKLFLVSTVPAAFGGSSGLMWANFLMPDAHAPRTLIIQRSQAWWIAAAIIGIAYIVFLGRGIEFAH